MEGYEKKHILLLGLDHRMLWQLTRTLAHLEDRIDVDCVPDASAAKEICDRQVVDVIVVDGWDQAWQAAHHLAGDEAFEGGPWRWIILVDSLPLESLPAGKLTPSAVFLEKPFNPKAFPPFLLGVVEEGEAREQEEVPEPLSDELSLPVTRGETYKEPDARPSVEGEHGGEAVPGTPPVEEPTQSVAEPPDQPAEPSDFYREVDMGFACLGEKDWKGAEEHWRRALEIRPDDGRLAANLRRLERLKEH